MVITLAAVFVLMQIVSAAETAAEVTSLQLCEITAVKASTQAGLFATAVWVIMMVSAEMAAILL